MNRSDSGTSPVPTPMCIAFAPLLPLLAGGELSAEDAVATRTHLASCRWCQSQLATYDTLDAALRRHYGEGEHTIYFLSMEDVMSDFEQDAQEITQPAYSPLHSPVTPGGRPPRGPTRQLSVIGAVAAVLLIALFAGTIYALHGRQGAQPTASATATSTVAPTATIAPTATPLPSGASACGESGGTPLSVSKIHFARYGSADLYYYARLADDLALRPQITSDVVSNAPGVALKDNAIFDLEIPAPPASQPGYICAATVRIVSFQPLPGQATNVYRPCVGQNYYDPGGWNPSTACPASPIPAGSGTVTLPTADVGTSATGAISGYTSNFQPSNQPAVEPPPLNSDSSHSPYPTDVIVGIKVPQAGTYTFAIGLWQDRSGPSITMPDVTLQFLFGQALHEWSGEACTQADMQSQLPPPTNPPTRLICPGPPPQ
ncbi:MAG TPA: zf-HC2 domain-containing protein [Ktedonobacterales bacterium]